MRILMLCAKYPLDPNDPYMTNELAAAFASAGHEVQVVAIDWDAALGAPKRLSQQRPPGVKALVVSPTVVRGFGGFVRNASKWTLSSLFALPHMRRVLAGQRFDVMVCFTPCVTIAAQLLWATRRAKTPPPAARSVLIVFDFFPYHHHSIGLVPGGPVFAAARLFETALMRRFHVIGCTTPANMAYLAAHYRLQAEQKVVWTPLWGEIAPPMPRPREIVRSAHGLPLDRKIVVFGGQITEGRGIDEMLIVAAIAERGRPDLAFLFVGDGRLVPLIEQRIASGLSNVFLKSRLAREDYLVLLSACDLGLIATVPQVDSTSFPTKTIDYLRASLPIVAAVEETSDYAVLLRQWKVGVAVPAGNAKALYAAVSEMVDDPRTDAEFARLARACLEEVFDVGRAARRILESVAAISDQQ